MYKRQLVRLAHIYEACYKLAHVPETLQESIIAFINKPGKKDYTQCKSWRPITLLNFLFKGLEKVILRHLQEVYGEKSNSNHNKHTHAAKAPKRQLLKLLIISNKQRYKTDTVTERF